MPKSNRRKKESSRKAYRKSQAYLDGGGESQYARKRSYLHKNGLWGFEVQEPKPWKKGQGK